MSSTAEVCEQLVSGLGPLFQCAPHGDYIRIRTPFLYPDGDIIDVFCRREGNVWLISDLGETLRWLRMQTTSKYRSKKQEILMQEACLTHGVELQRGALLARCREGESFADSVLRVAQAALRVSDLWFNSRTRATALFQDEVEDFLRESGFSYQRDYQAVGRSGRSWQVDFYVRATNRSSLVESLSTGNRAMAQRLVEHVVALWHDLSYLGVGPEALQFVSLFDDTEDIWAEEHFRQLESLSRVARWSNSEEFLQILQAA
ncbi:hypothetical protein HRbin36_01763 [bacterium HR36]|nr:hypothetical protein HRbin36_01763 [bacterium HR36]